MYVESMNIIKKKKKTWENGGLLSQSSCSNSPFLQGQREKDFLPVQLPFQLLVPWGSIYSSFQLLAHLGSIHSSFELWHAWTRSIHTFSFWHAQCKNLTLPPSWPMGATPQHPDCLATVTSPPFKTLDPCNITRLNG